MNKYSLESERRAPPLRRLGQLSLLHAGIGEVPAGAPQWRAGGFRTLLLCWCWRGGLHSLLSTAGSLTNLPDSGFSLQPLSSLQNGETCLFLKASGSVSAFVGQTCVSHHQDGGWMLLLNHRFFKYRFISCFCSVTLYL